MCGKVGKSMMAGLLSGLIILSLAACGNQNDDKEVLAEEITEVMESTATDENQEMSEAAETEDIYGFKVSGNKLLDANGNEFVMRGVNYPHAWYAANDIKSLDGIAANGANCVRIVLSDGMEYNLDSAETVAALISRCKMLNMIAVLEVHDGTGSNSAMAVQNAVDFWIDIKEALEGNEAYAILNIINEWQGNYNKNDYKNTYVKAVSDLRNAGIKNTILIDASGWGQTAKSVPECGPEILAADKYGNTMFAIHMYGTAGKNENTIRKSIDDSLNANLCICIGEFGYKHSDGDVDEAFIMSYCQEKSIGYMAWSWKGNSGGVEYLDMSNDWEGNDLTADWGQVVINGPNGIKETSKKCSVFIEE